MTYSVNGASKAVPQVLNHTSAALLWRKNPELFKLLTDCSRCGDNNNFNFLLSNNVESFDILDETIATSEVGKSWGGHSIQYGSNFSGEGPGEFSCRFSETDELSIINLMKLWITYIHNVSRGIWHPSYNLRYDGVINRDRVDYSSESLSYVYSKTLDYAASVYVFKCAPNGEDVLYWTKYYGVFPINTGSNSLSWDKSNSIGDFQDLNIRFKYCFKKDLSPISLIEFNDIANVDVDFVDKDGTEYTTYETSFNRNYGHSSRPFVGPPFIELRLANPILTKNGVAYDQARSSIKLKFKRDANVNVTDRELYHSSL